MHAFKVSASCAQRDSSGSRKGGAGRSGDGRAATGITRNQEGPAQEEPGRLVRVELGSRVSQAWVRVRETGGQAECATQRTGEFGQGPLHTAGTSVG